MMKSIAKLIRITKVHLAYLINKSNIIILSIIGTIFIMLALYKSNILKTENEQLLYANYYQESYNYLLTTIFKLIIILFSTYIFSSLKSISSFLIIKCNKATFYISKYIASTTIIIIITIIYFFVYIGVALLTKWYRFDATLIKNLFEIVLICILTGSLSQILSYVFKSSLSFIVVYFMYIVIDNLSEFEITTDIVMIFFQIALNSNYELIILFIQIILYFVLGFYLFKKYETY